MRIDPLTLACTAMSLAGSFPANAQSGPDFTTHYRFDELGHVTGKIGPDPDGEGSGNPRPAVRNTYDADGRLVRIETGTLYAVPATSIRPASWSGFAAYKVEDAIYDVMNRKLTETVRDGALAAYALTQYSYDADGRLECTAVRMNPAAFGALPASACTLGSAGSQGPDRITRNVHDAAGQLLKVQKAVGTSAQIDDVRYEYTVTGKRRAVIDANGNRAELTYDGHDRQARWIFPSKTSVGSVDPLDYEEYGYDPNGNRTWLRKRDGRRIAYGYDALNRVTSKTYAGGGARAVHYRYDLRGLPRVAWFDAPQGVDAVYSAWDGFGQLSSSTTAMGGTSRMLTYQYNANGARTRVTHPDGTFANYRRDGLDRLHYSDLNGATPLFYPPNDAAGRVSNLYRFSQGAGSWTFGTNFAYDGMSRVSSYGHAFSGGGAVTTALGYNPASQVTSRTRDNDDYRFTGYVNVGRSYGANGLNQYVSAGSAVFTYDANGNLTSDGTTSYAYDVENRLTSSSAGAALTYDPLGRLWQVHGPGSGATQFLYDGDALTAEYDGSGNMLRRYVHGPGDGQDDPMVEYAGSGTSSPRYLFADHQGSIIAAADANGNRTHVNSYDEYGIPAVGNTGRFQYTGQAWIPELGMYHYKARVYSPTLGRFLQTDPIGYDDQINLYAYVANDPVNHTDPDGEAIETVWDVANIAMGVASAGANIATGNYGRAAVDIAGVLVDTAAAVVPGVPGGAGTAIRAVRGAERGVEAARASGRFASKAEKASLFNRAGGKCEYCGKGMTREPGRANSMHADHITPHIKGGKTEGPNLAGSCRTCNLSKGSKDLSTQPGRDKFVPPNPNDRIQDRLRKLDN